MAEQVFDALFNLSIQHDFLRQGVKNAFAIQPSLESRKQLRRNGLLFKPFVEYVPAFPLQRAVEGYHIIVEKIVSPEPAMPLRKIQTFTGFTFEIALNQTALLNQVEPFTKTENGTRIPQALTVPFGRRILYFNNVEDNGALDEDVILSKEAAVSTKDVWSLIPEQFTVPKIVNNATKLAIQSLTNSFTSEYVIKSTQTKIDIKLPPGIYRFSWRGGSNASPALVLVNSELYKSNLLGVIQIFKDKTVDYDVMMNYTLKFKT